MSVAPPQAIQVKKAARSRRWTFTINNYPIDSFDGRPVVHTLARQEARITTYCAGEEVAPTTGMKHIQGYFEVKNPMRLTELLSWPFLLDSGVHLEQARGSREQNWTYCSKEDEYAEKFGDWTQSRKNQGVRTDWHTLHEDLAKGASLDDILETHPQLGYRYWNSVPGWLAHHNVQEREWKTVPHVFYGPTRAGKSTLMRARAKELAEANGWRVYFKSDADKWWPFYDGQEIICIDEMHGGFFSWTNLLRFFEEGPYEVQVKGGTRRFLGRHCFMTCNDHPAYWYRTNNRNYRPWDATNAFRARIAEFGELLVFSSPVDTDSGRVYAPPVRDMRLEQPALPEGLVQELDDNRHMF